MGAVDEGGSHQSRLTAEHTGIDALQLVASHIVIAVAGGSGKIARLYPLFGKGLQHLFGAHKSNAVDLCKTAAAPRLSTAGQLGHLIVHICNAP